MAKKAFSAAQLMKLTSREINDKIIHDNYSLLETLGASQLRKEMVPIGKVCRAAIGFFVGTTGPKSDKKLHFMNARKRLVRVLSKLTPGKYDGFPHDNKNGMVVGFNHPSLGEIPRILLLKIDKMGDKPMLFPVNLPWYEALAQDYDQLKSLGIIITPMITPSTWEKLGLKTGTQEYKAGERIKKGFRELYTDLAKEVIRNGGVIFVAPSATRQQTVFKSAAVLNKQEDVIPTMSVLAAQLFADADTHCDFVPMGVLPPDGYGKGLNFFKTYELRPGEIMRADYIRKKYMKNAKNGRLNGFDYDFHERIAKTLPAKFRV